jgi:copper chaperone CopZ
MANKARAALSQVKGVESVIVDTTARAVLRMKDDAKPSEKTLNSAVEKMGMKVKKLQKRKIPIAAAVYKIRVEGVR